MSSNPDIFMYSDLDSLDRHTKLYLEILWRNDVNECIQQSTVYKFETFKNDAMIFLKVWGYI
jgi:hypothetical protein